MSILSAAVCVLATALAVAGSPVEPLLVVGPSEQSVGGASLRISGGSKAALGDFPYQVALFSDANAFLCSGSIISAKSVLTAAQCVYGIPGAIKVQAGIIKLDGSSPDDVRRTTADDRIIHPNFDPEYLDNDIAIITLPFDLAFSENVASIMLPLYSEVGKGLVSGSTVYASGWGKTSDDSSSPTSNSLMWTDLRVADQSKCVEEYGASVIGTKWCASGVSGTSTCTGDLGGPVTMTIGNGPRAKTYLAGIVSFGSPKGCTLSKPVVFTRVSAFYDFIEKNSDVKVADVKQ